MDIDEYLAKTRKAFPVSNLVEKHYREMFTEMRELIPLNTDVRFRVYYSTNRACNTLIFNGETFIIFDQYLGQTLDVLTRIFFNSSTQDDGIMYAHKLLAENFQLTGESMIGAYYALMHLHMKKDCKSYKEDTETERRRRYVLLQEYMVITHELYHVMFDSSDPNWKQETLECFREDYTDLMQRAFQQSRNNEDKRIEQYLNDGFYTHYPFFNRENDDMDPKEVLGPEEWATLRSHYSEHIRRGYLPMQELMSRDGFIEELFCDVQTILALSLFADQCLGISEFDAYEAMLVGMLNLRLLSLIRQYCLIVGKSSTDSLANFFNESNARLIYFKGQTRKIALDQSGVNASEQVKRRFSSTIDRYATLIRDPILYLIYQKREAIENQRMKFLPQLDNLTDHELNMIIDAL